jgi:hypothetical protein
MKKTSLTFTEALQLVKQQLGLSYCLMRHGGWWHVFDRTTLKCSGRSLLEAVENAGIDVPEAANSECEFVAVGAKVMRGSERIADARSTNFANRIANALNEYEPDHRGQ